MSAFEPVDNVLDKHEPLDAWTCFLGIITVVGIVIAQAAFNATTWNFGFHYFSCASKLQFVFHQKSVPTSHESRLKVLFWILLGINVIVPVVIGVFALVLTLKNYHNYHTDVPYATGEIILICSIIIGLL